MLTDSSGAISEKSLLLKINGVVAEARHTPQAHAKDKASHGVDEQMRGVEEQKQGHKDRYNFDIRLCLTERQLQHVRPGSSLNLLSTACSIVLSRKWSMLRALEKPLWNLTLN